MSTSASLTSPGPTSHSDNVVKTPIKDSDDSLTEEEDKDPDEKDILHGTKLVLALVAMLLSLFLVALDGVS
jgi:hypothetical protein